jgi:two-component system, OmpR family, KDP operon response regulator KdpE
VDRGDRRSLALRSNALVLVAQDESPTLGQLTSALSDQGLRVMGTETAVRQVVAQAANHNPDVIILDVGISEGDATRVVTRLREFTTAIIMILANETRELDRIAALDAGANEFLTRPVELGEVLARLRVWMRNRWRTPGRAVTTVLDVGDLRVDFSLSRAWVAGREVRLSPLEYRLFAMMMRNADRILTHEEILLGVWGSAYRREPQYLRIYMRQLRQKFEVDPGRPRYFLTERAVGYRLQS